MTEPAFFAAHRRAAAWIDRSAWPFAWISGGRPAPTVGAYRLRFTSPAAEQLRLVVSADERYRLYCDGRLLASGPEIGTRFRWQADAIDLALKAGEHCLLAVVWSVGDRDGDFATDGIGHGFALGIDGEANPRLATGTAAWEWHELPGYRFRKSPLAHWTVPDLHRDGSAADWEVEEGRGEGWIPAVAGSAVHHVADVEVHPARLVEVGTLPPQTHVPWRRLAVRHAEVIDSAALDPADLPLGANDPRWREAVQALVEGRNHLAVPARTTLRAVIDCQDYVTAWPELSAGGFAAGIDLTWMEALSLERVRGASIPKGNRGEIAGRFVGGTVDRFRLDRAVRSYRPLFWRSGRFLVLTVASGEQPVTVAGLRLVETRYPLEQESHIEPADPALARVLPLCLRTLQVNAHDQYSDTPYYERMQYLGDCRLDCLTTYAITRDARLPAKALRMVDAQRMPDGLTVSRTPTRNLQVIPPFSLWYVGMVRDHLWWRGDEALVRELMPGVRGVIERFLRARRDDGSIGFLEGWNFCDWAKGFPHGEPPGTSTGSGPMNLQVLMALDWAAELEEALGEPELAARWRRLSSELAGAVTAAFWDEARGAWTDDREGGALSQHAQVLAALCAGLDPGRRWRGMQRVASDPALVRSSIYFSHYLIEAWAAQGEGQRVAGVLDFWKALPDQGFVSLPEQPEPSRSDCHAWSAHPLFHAVATLAGIRPDAPAFARVRIAPCPGPLPALNVAIPHPAGGEISASLRFAGATVEGTVVLPAGLEGTFVWQGDEQVLRPGTNRIATAGQA